MMAFALLAGASIACMAALVGFCLGYGLGHSAATAPLPPTRTTTNTVPLASVRFNAAEIVFPHDTSRGLLQ